MLRALSCTRSSPVGSARGGPNNTERDHLMNWSYVGAGHGNFELNERYGYVGNGEGAWKREVETCYEGWRIKPQCKALMVILGACSFGVALGFAIRQTPGTYDQLQRLRGRVASIVQSLPAMEVDPNSAQLPNETDLFDCNLDLADWQSKWSVGRMDWCCQAYGKGCRDMSLGVDSKDTLHVERLAVHFDCSARHPEDLRGWTRTRSDWCCEQRGVACNWTRSAQPREVGAKLAKPDGNGRAEADAEHELSREQAHEHHREAADTNSGPEVLYDCKEGAAADWTASKKAFCEHREKYDCDAVSTDGWSLHQKGWCCEFHDRGCPRVAPIDGHAKRHGDASDHAEHEAPPAQPVEHRSKTEVHTARSTLHDCESQLSDWVTAWSPERKAWCCRHRQRACPPVPSTGMR